MPCRKSVGAQTTAAKNQYQDGSDKAPHGSLCSLHTLPPQLVCFATSLLARRGKFENFEVRPLQRCHCHMLKPLLSFHSTVLVVGALLYHRGIQSFCPDWQGINQNGVDLAYDGHKSSQIHKINLRLGRAERVSFVGMNPRGALRHN